MIWELDMNLVPTLIHLHASFLAHGENSKTDFTLPLAHCELGRRGRGLVAALSVGTDAFVIDADFHLVQCPISKIYQSLQKDNGWICTELFIIIPEKPL